MVGMGACVSTVDEEYGIVANGIKRGADRSTSRSTMGAGVEPKAVMERNGLGSGQGVLACSSQ